MKNVYEILKAKKLELQALQQEVAALEIAAPLLCEEQDKLISGMDEKPLSQAQMIRAVLLASGGPMDSSQISAAVSHKYRVTLKPPYVASTIYRYIRKHKYFAKAEGPNTFALLEWTATNQIAPLRIVEGR